MLSGAATSGRAAVDEVKAVRSTGFDPKMQALLRISETVGRNALELTAADVEAAKSAGATDADVQLAVLIAAGFSMYNRLVDGFRAQTPPVTEVYRERAAEIAAHGYSAPGPGRHPAQGELAAPAAPFHGAAGLCQTGAGEWRNGRRAGLRSRCRETCEFESRLAHHQSLNSQEPHGHRIHPARARKSVNP